MAASDDSRGTAVPRSRTITGLPAGTRVETLPSMPTLGGLYLRGAAGSAAARLPGQSSSATLPAVAHRVTGVRVDAAHLTDYQHLVGETGTDTLPSGYCHVLAFPIATAVMVRSDFPLPLLGMVHVANAASVLRPLRLGDTLDITAWTQDLRPHRRGAQLDVCAEIVSDGGVAWRGVSTYLAKGVTLAGHDDEVPEARASGGGERQATSGMGGAAAVSWRLDAGVGRAYGAVSGDRNPIHMSALSAKAFGFPRAIAHGMYTAARALADIGAPRGATYDWTVEFAKPVLLPGRVGMTYQADADGAWAYAGHSQSGTLHLAGTVTPRPTT
ncbi:MaoC/PaaZ C-terminal domain-containing protein [Sanguibacter sp. A247]|uniref:MaoC/PaaZ C-terminal domain-containing protein n=1 Tax=unclassified Sanguibacter TaxID=2645534 RepID=UPI003FD7FD88